MAHARVAERGFPQSAVFIVLAVLVAVMLAAIAAFAILDPFGLRAPAISEVRTTPAVIDSGRQWEFQRLQQGGYVNPVLDSGRQWEIERLQQSGAN
ncbi:MAG: hypothetical protein ABI534_02100 [Chloroflexota bacterium]